jgi:ammonium transporter, Amt family
MIWPFNCKDMRTMKLKSLFTYGATLGAALLTALPALADTPVPDKGDTTWMLISTVLVLLMTIPGLALFYGGLVRSKNMLSVLTQVFMIVAVVTLLWVFYGYSMAFTGGSPYVGGFGKAFLKGVDATTLAATFSTGVYIPEYVYIAFQMTFACITPALIVGAFAERVKFSGMMVFMILWVTLVYFPIAHMVWFWDGPDTFVAAAKEGEAAFNTALGNAGIMFQWGAIDFAGGTVVHINAGIAGLVLCIICGKRIGFGKEAMPPHSLTMTMIGAALLWVGWFGFNAGSNLEANGLAALAMINTFVATAAAAVSWMVVEWLHRGKPSLLGGVTGAVAGLVAVTPPSGFAGPMGCIILGLLVSPLCYFFCSAVKNKFKYDDALDVFGVHCIGGIVGALATGVLVNPALGGQGVMDFLKEPGTIQFVYDANFQIMAQVKAVAFTLVYSGVLTAIIGFLVHKTIGLRVSSDVEREGLDLAEHGERAYSY